jgi:hypothetical protein
MRNFKTLLPGTNISAKDYNRLTSAVETHERISVEFPLEIVPDRTGTHIRCVLPGFWAMLTSSTSPYNWVEVRTNGSGVFEPYGRNGTSNAFEVNDQEASEGAIVWMIQNNNVEFLFEYVPIIDRGSSSSSGPTIVSVEIAIPPFSCVSGGTLQATTAYINFENGLFLSVTLEALGTILTPH